MSDTTYTPPPPPVQPPAPRPRLTRSRSDRKLAGVCGGLAEHLGIDPIILRVLVVVLTIFGGSGLLLYAAGWLLIPDEGQDKSEAQRVVDRNGGAGTAVVALVGAAVVLVLLATLLGLAVSFGGGHWWVGGGPDIWPLVIVAGVVAAVWWARRTPSAPVASTPPDPYASSVATDPAQTQPTQPAYPTDSGASQPYATQPYATQPYAQPPVPPVPPEQTAQAFVPPPRPPAKVRERSVLTPLVLSLLLVAAGVMVLLGRAGAWHLRAVPFLAVLLGIVGVGLVVGAFVGRGRGLIGMGVLLTLVTAVVAAVPGSTSGRTGNVVWAPTTVASIPAGGYTWAAGRVDLDLTGLAVTSPTEVSLDVGAGDVTVTVPKDVDLVVRSHVGVGTTRLPDGVRADGFGRDNNVTYAAVATPSRGTLTLVLDLGAGKLEVDRAQA